MRAEELASQLDNYTTSNKRVLVNWSNDAAAMLRRQSSEIERLEARVKELEGGITQLMRNFPTDFDMTAAGWDGFEIESACAAHDAARALLEKSNG